MKTRIMVGAGLAASALAWAASDPVIMTVNGVDVPKSEFEYLYHKNSQQQLDPRPLEEYVEMFKLYKLKVADARANGLDTTAAYRAEMEQYASELAAPYLSDSTYINTLVKEATDRMQTEAEARHIMIFKGNSVADKRANRLLADSIRGVIRAGGDLGELAERYSTDPNSARRAGNMGFISAGKYPYYFEKAVFETPEDSVAPLVESPYGYHVVVGGRKQPSRGSVLARHILVLVHPKADAAEENAARLRADSICSLLKADPERFAELATELSDDKRSGQQGGMLPWFMAGEMIPEFADASFALKDGEISEPVRSSVGFHIIQRLDSRPVADAASMRSEVLARISNPQDERYELVAEQQTARLAKKYKMALNRKVTDTMRADAIEMGLDSAFMAKYSSLPCASQTLMTVGKTAVPVGEFIATISDRRFSPFTEPEVLFDGVLNGFFADRVNALAESRLEQEVPEYRNLLNEYREGSLLYEISLRRVWDKASKDNEGLERYFQTHRSDYDWKEPHVKGYLIQASNDSVAALIRQRLDATSPDSVVRVFRKEFGPRVGQIERVLATKGQNTMVDNLMFGAPAVQPQNSAFTSYFLYDARVIDRPEELNDVRALVTNDYQTWLEQEWLDELRERYPVTVNQKVLKKVK